MNSSTTVANALRLDEVHLSRGGRNVLHGVSLSAPAGALTVVIGPNGSGKSSLMLAAAGLLPVTRGAVLLGDAPVRALSHRERAQRVAYVPQRSDLTAALPVRAVVAMGRYAHGTSPSADAAAVTDALAAVDGLHLAARAFTTLSGGEAQRVLIARALATGAGTLLLDEPTSALDVGHRVALGALLRRLATAGRTIVVALHDLAEAQTLATQVVLLVDGRVLAAGAPDTVITEGPILAAYGVRLVPGGGFGYTAP